MSRHWKTLVASLVVVCATSVIILSSASPGPEPTTAPTPATQTRRATGTRNLSLQPEAFKLSRRLGARFSPKGRGSTITAGTLFVGTDQQPATIIRRQTDAGESVDIILGNRKLTWNDSEGVKGLPSSPTAADRLLAEQLILDSPDQFVFAQLRGASYFTVARNVRPADATDGYTGPLWTLVRVDEPKQSENAQPLSTWRIYYINAETGLPDRIEYQLNGNDIRTDFAEWTEQDGENTPSRVTWSIAGRVVMEYRTTQVDHNK